MQRLVPSALSRLHEQPEGQPSMAHTHAQLPLLRHARSSEQVGQPMVCPQLLIRSPQRPPQVVLRDSGTQPPAFFRFFRFLRLFFAAAPVSATGRAASSPLRTPVRRRRRDVPVVRERVNESNRTASTRGPPCRIGLASAKRHRHLAMHQPPSRRASVATRVPVVRSQLAMPLSQEPAQAPSHDPCAPHGMAQLPGSGPEHTVPLSQPAHTTQAACGPQNGTQSASLLQMAHPPAPWQYAALPVVVLQTPSG